MGLRLAGNIFGMIPKAGKWLTKDVGAGELALRLGMDGLGAVSTMAYTPGDLGDKLLAGGTNLVASSVPGLAAGRLGGKGAAGTILDMAGSMAGAHAGMYATDHILSAKSALSGQGYKTPWAKIGEEEQARLAEMIRQDTLAQYGLVVPGSPVGYVNDPTTGMGVA